MEHYIFLFYLISLSTGILSIGISTGIYLHYRREPILYYILFLISLALIIVSLSITRYLAILRMLYFRRTFSPVDVLGFLGLFMVMVVLPHHVLDRAIHDPGAKAEKHAQVAIIEVEICKGKMYKLQEMHGQLPHEFKCQRHGSK